MTQNNEIQDFAANYAASVKSEFLQQRILQDAGRKPHEALQDAVAILNLLEPINTSLATRHEQSLFAKRLLEDLSRHDLESSLSDVRIQIDFLTKALNMRIGKVSPEDGGGGHDS